MRLVTIKQQTERPAIVLEEGVVPLQAITEKIGTAYAADLFTLIQNERVLPLRDWFVSEGHEWLKQQTGRILPFSEITLAPLYRQPKQIFGIGVNYMEQATALGTDVTDDLPGCFIKPASTIIGTGDVIQLPTLPQASQTTGEAELAIVMKNAKNISIKNWEDAIVGYTTALDMTEKSILLQNPRFMAIAKSFDTFFSFGPELITPDEIPDVTKLEVQTHLNGRLLGKNVVSQMAHPPAKVISLISQIQGWSAGDVLATGTPKATPLASGDHIECRIFGENGLVFRPLVNPVGK